MNRIFLPHIELWLSAAGLLIILLIPALVGAERDAYWQLAAITATGVGIIHGCIFWLIRQRQRTVRRTAIAEIRTMLKDRINNRLTAISLQVAIAVDSEALDDLANIQVDISMISRLLDNISEESMQEWQDKYANVLG